MCPDVQLLAARSSRSAMICTFTQTIGSLYREKDLMQCLGPLNSSQQHRSGWHRPRWQADHQVCTLEDSNGFDM